MAKQYSTILIDWDGTLAKTLEVWIEILHGTFSRYGLRFSDQRLLTLISSDWNGMLDLGIGGGMVSKIVGHFKKSAQEKLKDVPLHDGVITSLREFKNEGKKLGLVTSNDLSSLEATVANAEVAPFFDVLLTSDDLEDVKPDPECIYKAVALLKGDLAETILIGDSESDLKAAASANVDSILYYPESHKAWYDLNELEKENPTYICQDWDAVRKIVMGN